ncbi:MAG: SRPBCC family protein [Gammaproteobacteria bacterium]|nr:SRPBCC family protein [Gammaproteobacteria bacterium]MDH3413210.1 SRPBCC family protein [Gammaproteobacteria bacterium]
MSTELNALANQECKLIGGLEAMPSRHPAAEESHTEGEGAVRPLSLVGGGTIVKRLERVEIKERVYSYSIVDGPLPVSDQVATIKVGEKGDGTAAVVERSSGFRPSGASESEAQESVQAIYDAGLENLGEIFGGRV